MSYRSSAKPLVSMMVALAIGAGPGMAAAQPATPDQQAALARLQQMIRDYYHRGAEATTVGKAGTPSAAYVHNGAQLLDTSQGPAADYFRHGAEATDVTRSPYHRRGAQVTDVSRSAYHRQGARVTAVTDQPYYRQGTRVADVKGHPYYSQGADMTTLGSRARRAMAAEQAPDAVPDRATPEGQAITPADEASATEASTPQEQEAAREQPAADTAPVDEATPLTPVADEPGAPEDREASDAPREDATEDAP